MAIKYRKRLQKVMRVLESQGPRSALLIGSNAPVEKSRDSFHPFRQSSDFYYLTGSAAPGVALLLSTERKRPVLLAPPPRKGAPIWDDPSPSTRALADTLHAELIESQALGRELPHLLRGIERLYFQNEPHSVGWALAEPLFATASHSRAGIPPAFIHSDRILERLRLFKEPEETAAIRAAAEVTNAALFSSLPVIQKGVSETQLASALDYFMQLQGSGPSFPTIVARGRNAAILHHAPDPKALFKSGDLVLIDCGSLHAGYASDITRVIPVQRGFKGAQRDLYAAVFEAQRAAIRKVKHGVKIMEVYLAAVRVMVSALKDLRVLKGSATALVKGGACRDYFPHGIGHSLGLDVHDIGNLRANNDARLEAGMVFTVEPGLYFRKGVRGLPPCGIRIEDDVLVTKSGCEVLSEGFPKAMQDIEALLG